MANNVPNTLLGYRGFSPSQILRRVGAQAKARRLALGRSQRDVAEAAGISRATLLRFEAGQSIDFQAVIRVLIALDAENDLASLFPLPETRTLDEILAATSRPRRVRAPRRKRADDAQ
jgi:transcriptional regulator with XRE-family HTH domain